MAMHMALVHGLRLAPILAARFYAYLYFTDVKWKSWFACLDSFYLAGNAVTSF